MTFKNVGMRGEHDIFVLLESGFLIEGELFSPVI